ncbi:MAG: hypothetical protein AAB676_14160 [Verrucomicrobiota bacterium]
MVEDVFEGFIGLAECAEGFVEDPAIRFGSVVEFVLEIIPAGAFGDEEAVVVIGVFAILLRGVVQRHALLDLPAHDPFVLSVEHI